MPEGVVGIMHGCLAAVSEGCCESYLPHVQFLPHIRNAFAVDALAVDVEVHVEQVKAAQKVAHPATPVLVVGAGQHHILYFERISEETTPITPFATVTP